MSFTQEEKIKMSVKITEILLKAKISSANYSSTSQPFFYNDNNSNLIYFSEIPTDMSMIPDKLNRNIKLFYELIRTNDKEIYIGEWTFFSINEALEKYQNYCSENRKNIWDIAYKYLGMGYVEVLSCDLDDHLLFLRQDGGSNGYDRAINYKNLIEKGSDSYNKFIFSKWFFNLL